MNLDKAELVHGGSGPLAGRLGVELGQQGVEAVVRLGPGLWRLASISLSPQSLGGSQSGLSAWADWNILTA